MALNIPMPESPGTSFLQGADTGSTLMSRMMQPILEREKMKQQQSQFAQNLVLYQQAQQRANALMPYMIQQYKDTHRTAASEADMKDLYRNLLKDALNNPMPQPGGGAPMSPPPGAGAPPGMPPQLGGGQPNAPQPGMPPQMGGVPPQMGGMPPQMGGAPNAAPGLPQGGQPPAPPQIGAGMPPMGDQGAQGGQEHELRAGNPRLTKLDQVAGLVPGIPKPVTHFSNGMIFTTYPSGRMTVQKVQGQQTPGQMNVSAKEASKLRDQATVLANSANLVNQGYGLLDNNPDLTGIGSGAAAMLNLSSNPELGKFTTVTGKLQAELGKYAASRGGIQAVKWAGSVKPSTWKPEDYNYGMFEGIQQNLQDDYNTLNQQYKAATGEDLPIPLPKMTSNRGGKKEYPIKFPEMPKTFVTKEDVTEANILHTMKETGFSRDKVMKRLKKKGLA
jgi:hypothetical protein